MRTRITLAAKRTSARITPKSVAVATVKSPALHWPATTEELKAAGYVDHNKSKWCSCGKVMFWFSTPAGKFIPLERTKDGRWEPHHAKCKHVKAYRGATHHAEAARPRAPKQESLF